MDEIKELLDKLADFQSQRDLLNIKKQELIDAVLTAEIKAKLADIDAELAPDFSAVDTNSAELEKKVKEMVLSLGESVKGTYLHAVWAKGRVSWDTKSIDGYAIAHPELLSFRKEGDPSVSIRSAK